MKCSYCNSDIPDNSRFCPICGGAQEVAVETPQNAPAASAEDILAGIQANAPEAPTPEAPVVEAPKATEAPVYEAPKAPETPIYEAPAVQEYTQPVQEYTQPAQDYTQPAQDYTQPVQGYVPPAQSYAPPANNYTQPVGNYAQPAAPLKATKKKGSKKGLIIGICAAAVLLIAAALAYFLLFAGSPVSRALNGTLNDGSAMLHAGNLGKAVSAVENINKSGKATAVLSFDASALAGETVKGTVDMSVDTKATMFGGTVDFTLGEAGGVARLVGDKTDAQFAADGMDGVYGVSYADLLEQAGLSRDALDNLTFEQQPVTLAALKNGPLKPFFDSMETKEVGQTRIGETVCKHYTLTWDDKTLEALADKYDDMDPSDIVRLAASGQTVETLSYSIAQMLIEMEPQAEVYIAGNKLRGLDLTSEYDDPYYIRFLGDKNVWEHARLNTEDTQVDLYWEKAGTLRLCMTDDGEETELLRYDDATGKFHVSALDAMDGAQVDGTIAVNGKAASLDLRATLEGQTVTAALTEQPLDGKLALLGESYTDVLTMSADAQEKLLTDLSNTLKLDQLDPYLFGGLLDSGSSYDWDDDDDWNTDDWNTDWNWDEDDTDATDATEPAYNADIDPDGVAGSYDLSYLESGSMKWDIEELGMDKEDNYITLWSDNTGVLVLGGDSAQINWEYADGKVIITDRDSDTEYYELIVLDEDRLAIDADGSYLVFERDK